MPWLYVDYEAGEIKSVSDDQPTNDQLAAVEANDADLVRLNIRQFWEKAEVSCVNDPDLEEDLDEGPEAEYVIDRWSPVEE